MMVVLCDFPVSPETTAPRGASATCAVVSLCVNVPTKSFSRAPKLHGLRSQDTSSSTEQGDQFSQGGREAGCHSPVPPRCLPGRCLHWEQTGGGPAGSDTVTHTDPKSGSPAS